MKKIFISVLCILTLVSCVSSYETQMRQKKIADAIYQEGKVYFSQKRYSIALGKMLEAEKTIKDDQFLQYDIGMIYMIKERYKSAAIHFARAFKLDNNFFPALNSLGAAYLEQKQWDKAITCFKQCSLSLFYATPHYSIANLGWAYLGKREYNTSESYFLKALKHVPNYLSALHGLISVYLVINREDLAISRLEKALKKLPDAMIIHYDLARTYEKIGQYSRAKIFWEKVTKEAPENSNFFREAEDRLSKIL